MGPPGRSASPELARHLAAVQAELAAGQAELGAAAVPWPDADIPGFAALAARLHRAGIQIGEARAFTGALSPCKTPATRAIRWAALSLLCRLLLGIPTGLWDRVLDHPDAAPLAFALRLRRRRASVALPPEQKAAGTPLETGRDVLGIRRAPRPLPAFPRGNSRSEWDWTTLMVR